MFPGRNGEDSPFEVTRIPTTTASQVATDSSADLGVNLISLVDYPIDS